MRSTPGAGILDVRRQAGSEAMHANRGRPAGGRREGQCAANEGSREAAGSGTCPWTGRGERTGRTGGACNAGARVCEHWGAKDGRERLDCSWCVVSSPPPHLDAMKSSTASASSADPPHAASSGTRATAAAGVASTTSSDSGPAPAAAAAPTPSAASPPAADALAPEDAAAAAPMVTRSVAMMTEDAGRLVEGSTGPPSACRGEERPGAGGGWRVAGGGWWMVGGGW